MVFNSLWCADTTAGSNTSLGGKLGGVKASYPKRISPPESGGLALRVGVTGNCGDLDESLEEDAD